MLTRPALSLIEANSFRGTRDGSASYQVFTNTLDVECPARNKVHHVCPQEGNKIEGWRSRPQLRAKGAEQPVHGCEVQRDRVGLGKEGSFQGGRHERGCFSLLSFKVSGHLLGSTLQ